MFGKSLRATLVVTTVNNRIIVLMRVGCNRTPASTAIDTQTLASIIIGTVMMLGVTTV